MNNREVRLEIVANSASRSETVSNLAPKPMSRPLVFTSSTGQQIATGGGNAAPQAPATQNSVQQSNGQAQAAAQGGKAG